MKMERAAIVRLVKDEDELWLHVKTPEGRTACVSLWSLAGPVVRDIFRAWADQHFKIMPAVESRLTEDELDLIHLNLTNNCGEAPFVQTDFQYGECEGSTVRFVGDVQNGEPGSKIFAEVPGGQNAYPRAWAIAQAGRAIKQLRDGRAQMMAVLKAINDAHNTEHELRTEGHTHVRHFYTCYMRFAAQVSQFLKG